MRENKILNYTKLNNIKISRSKVKRKIYFEKIKRLPHSQKI